MRTRVPFVLITPPSGAFAKVPTIGSVPSLLMRMNRSPGRARTPNHGETASRPPTRTAPVTATPFAAPGAAMGNDVEVAGPRDRLPVFNVLFGGDLTTNGTN